MWHFNKHINHFSWAFNIFRMIPDTKRFCPWTGFIYNSNQQQIGRNLIHPSLPVIRLRRKTIWKWQVNRQGFNSSYMLKRKLQKRFPKLENVRITQHLFLVADVPYVNNVKTNLCRRNSNWPDLEDKCEMKMGSIILKCTSIFKCNRLNYKFSFEM